MLLQRLGLDTSKLALCQPDSGEQALEVVDQSVRSSAVDIICVDSVAALVPRAEIEGEMGAHQGQKASIPFCSQVQKLIEYKCSLTAIGGQQTVEPLHEVIHHVSLTLPLPQSDGMVL